MRRCFVTIATVAILAAISTIAIRAEDWPEIRGKGRTGVWSETGPSLKSNRKLWRFRFPEMRPSRSLTWRRSRNLSLAFHSQVY